MNALTVARKEVTDARRSALVWALVALIGLVAVPTIVRFPDSVVTSATPDRIALVLLTSFERPVALAAVLVGGLAIAGERETGSLRVLSGFPLSRRDLLVGKLLGRGSVLIAVVLAGQVLIVAAVVYRLDGVSLRTFGHGAGLTLLFALAYFGIAVGASVVANTRLRALVLGLGAYIFFSSYWERVVVGPVFEVLRGRPPTDGELQFVIVNHVGTIDYLQLLNPNNAYTGANYFDPAVDWFGVTVLLGWFVVPVVLGYVRFRSQDVEPERRRPLAPLRRRLEAVSIPWSALPTPALPLSLPDHAAVAYGRADLTTLRRSRLILGLVAILVGQFVAAALSVPVPGADTGGLTPPPGVGTNFGPLFSELGTPLLIQFVAVLLGALAVVDGVETGRLRVLVGYPVRRRDVLVGTVVGRALLYVCSLATGLLAAAVVLWVRPTTVDPVSLALGGSSVAALGLAFFGIAVGASAFARRRITALGASFGAVVLFSAVWRTFVVGLPFLFVRGEFPGPTELAYTAGSTPQWYHYVLWVDPTEAYRMLGNVTGSLRFQLAGVLAFWAVVPVVVGYWRFRSRDIA
ncbi:ABC transporter permease subunit [Halosimplex salinum]|uniref:ABC transporter permease subunit n=1 Tax=Halosimplex salinum TaxID=1710538 RepID=UPI000F46A295|nr:ABC transporter permease subunit [Halosimplex salinum]